MKLIVVVIQPGRVALILAVLATPRARAATTTTRRRRRAALERSGSEGKEEERRKQKGGGEGWLGRRAPRLVHGRKEDLCGCVPVAHHHPFPAARISNEWLSRITSPPLRMLTRHNGRGIRLENGGAFIGERYFFICRSLSAD